MQLFLINKCWGKNVFLHMKSLEKGNLDKILHYTSIVELRSFFLRQVLSREL